MKTNLNIVIRDNQTAKKFLDELIENNEVYHPEDNAHDIIWACIEPTNSEKDRLNTHMADIYKYCDFCPCAYIIDTGFFEDKPIN